MELAENEQKARFVNLLPHDVCLLDVNNLPVVIPASGRVARCHRPNGTICDYYSVLGTTIRVRVSEWAIDDLPAPEPGVLFIVNSVIKDAVRMSGNPRSDLVFPCTRVQREDYDRPVYLYLSRV